MGAEWISYLNELFCPFTNQFDNFLLALIPFSHLLSQPFSTSNSKGFSIIATPISPASSIAFAVQSPDIIAILFTLHPFRFMSFIKSRPSTSGILMSEMIMSEQACSSGQSQNGFSLSGHRDGFGKVNTSYPRPSKNCPKADRIASLSSNISNLYLIRSTHYEYHNLDEFLKVLINSRTLIPKLLLNRCFLIPKHICLMDTIFHHI